MLHSVNQCNEVGSNIWPLDIQPRKTCWSGSMQGSLSRDRGSWLQFPVAVAVFKKTARSETLLMLLRSSIFPVEHMKQYRILSSLFIRYLIILGEKLQSLRTGILCKLWLIRANQIKNSGTIVKHTDGISSRTYRSLRNLFQLSIQNELILDETEHDEMTITKKTFIKNQSNPPYSQRNLTYFSSYLA